MRILIFIFTLFAALNVTAKTFPLPTAGNDVIGEVKNYIVREGDTFIKIAHDFDVGYVELREANPTVKPETLKLGTVLIIPSQYILPNAPRQGIVINVSEMRMYFYPDDQDVVMTFPVGVGREGSHTPRANMTVVEKIEKPTWYPTKETRAERAKDGVTFPKAVPPGPDNPLGEYALRLSYWSYLIHGTNENDGVGRRSSSGCVRMFEKDIKQLFQHVKVGADVVVISEPYKIGRSDGRLYFEAHLPLNEYQAEYANLEKFLHHNISGIVYGHKHKINWDKLMTIAKETQGMPQEIGDCI